MQAQYKYKFLFTFSKYPKKLKKIYNPCSQPTWPTPGNITKKYKVQNPNTHPSTKLYS